MIVPRRVLLVEAGAFLSAIEDAMSTEKPKLTPWFTPGMKPARVGEYNASMTKARDILRWWNGRAWSQPYTEGDTEAIKARKRKTASFNQGHHWRGLAANPAANKDVADLKGFLAANPSAIRAPYTRPIKVGGVLDSGGTA